MELAEYLDHLELGGEQLLRAARFAGLDAAVPSCPAWTVGSVVRHTSKVQHWATAILQGQDRNNFEFERPPDDELLSVFESGLIGLVHELRSARPSLEVWTMFPASSAVEFWARRQAHEVSIHRVDVELAADAGVADFDTAFAVDGLSELLVGMLPGGFSPTGLSGAHTITLAPLDANRGWTVSIGPDSVATVEEAHDDANLTVLGNASDLYRWAWNRASDHDVSLRGDAALAELWRRSFAIGARRG
jgi:uncharacterized protein (TIGR03083 family)